MTEPTQTQQDGKIGTVKEVVFVKSIKDEFRYRYSQYMAADDPVKKYNWLEGLVTMGIGYVNETVGELTKKEIERLLASSTENDAKPKLSNACVGVTERVPMEIIEKDAYWQMLPAMRKLWIPIHRALIAQGYMSWEDVSDKKLAFKALRDRIGKKVEPAQKILDTSDKIASELEKI